MKVAIDDLAVLGGPAVFPQPLHVGRPNIGKPTRLYARFDAMLDRRWLTNDGPLVEEFESRLAARLGVRQCVVTCNATAGLSIAGRALGMNGDVILPSFTFAGTIHALRWQGASPVYCDIDPRTHLINPAHVERLINARTTGIVGVHLWGRPCDAHTLGRIADRHGIPLLFDAAHAMGSTHGGRQVGGFGHAEVFSFHATKIINSFEGGAVTTNDDTLAAAIRALRNFGFSGQDYPEGLGINAKMSEASAAMGLTSLEALGDFMGGNERNYHCYRDGLAGVTGVELVDPEGMAATNHHYVVLEIDRERLGLSRDVVLRALTAEGVMARRYFYPGCHRIEPYRSTVSPREELPVTEHVADRVLQLPTGAAIDRAQIRIVCGLLRFIAAHAPSIRERLGETAEG